MMSGKKVIRYWKESFRRKGPEMIDNYWVIEWRTQGNGTKKKKRRTPSLTSAAIRQWHDYIANTNTKLTRSWASSVYIFLHNIPPKIPLSRYRSFKLASYKRFPYKNSVFTPCLFSSSQMQSSSEAPRIRYPINTRCPA